MDHHKPNNYDRNSDVQMKIENIVKLENIIYYDLSDSFSKYNGPELWVSPEDGHPNALGHEIIADEVFSILKKEEFLE